MQSRAGKRAKQTNQNPRHFDNTEAEALIGRLVRNEKGAWDEFHRQCMPAVKKSISAFLARYWKSVRSSDSKDDVLSRFYLTIIEDGSKRLKAFDPTRGYSFENYLTMLAREAVSHEMRRLVGKVGEGLDEVEASDAGRAGADPQRGANWIANPGF